MTVSARPVTCASLTKKDQNARQIPAFDPGGFLCQFAGDTGVRPRDDSEWNFFRTTLADAARNPPVNATLAFVWYGFRVRVGAQASLWPFTCPLPF